MSIAFCTYPANFLTPQSTEATRIVSSRNPNSFTGSGLFEIQVGETNNNIIFVVTQNADSVLAFTTDIATGPVSAVTGQYHIELVGDLQYSLIVSPFASFNPTVIVDGDSTTRVYRIIVCQDIAVFNVNHFFNRILPTKRNRTEVLQESLRGNIDMQRHSQSVRKRRIEYRSSFTSEEDVATFDAFVNEHDRFTFIRNSRVRYGDIFPAVIDGDIRDPYSGFYWGGGRSLEFVIQES